MDLNINLYKKCISVYLCRKMIISCKLFFQEVIVPRSRFKNQKMVLFYFNCFLFLHFLDSLILILQKHSHEAGYLS